MSLLEHNRLNVCLNPISLMWYLVISPSQVIAFMFTLKMLIYLKEEKKKILVI